MSNAAPNELNGGCPGPHDPLISNQVKLQLEDDMAKTLEDKEDVAVYKSTVEKVDIKSSSKYVGLSKEELERYLDDPYWKKMRYFFLVLFWFAWFAMFAAAIVIVISSPKCPPKPQLKWWQKKTCYQVWTRSYKDSNKDGIGDLAGLTEQLKVIRTFKASAIWPTPIIKSKSGSGYDILEHNTVDPDLGTIDDFKNLVETAHQKDMYVVMDLPLTTVSTDHQWFIKSAQKQEAFEDYFHWNDQQVDNKAWTKTGSRNQFYKHWGINKSFALLNWDNESVREAMKRVAKFWLDQNVDGFYLGEVQYMAVNEAGRPDWDKIHKYLKDFNAYMRNVSKITNEKREITLFTSKGFTEPEFGVDVDEFKLSMRLNADLDYVVNNELVNVNSSCEAECFNNHLSNVIDFHNRNNVSWPMWEIGHPFISRVGTRMGSKQRGEMVSLLLLTLPGSINMYYGDEIGMVDGISGTKANYPRAPMQWSGDANAGFTKDGAMPKILVNDDYISVNYELQNKAHYGTLRMYKRMAPLRQSEDAFLHGNMTLAPLLSGNNLLLVNTSSNYSSTHYLTILNFGPEQTFNLTEPAYNLHTAGREAMFIIGTTNVFQRKGFAPRDKVKPDALKLGQDEAIVLRVKPAK